MARSWEASSHRVAAVAVDHENINVKRFELHRSVYKRGIGATTPNFNSTSNDTYGLRNSTNSKASSAAGLGVVFDQDIQNKDGTSALQSSTNNQGSTSEALGLILTRYAKFSAIAYTEQCTKPNDASLVQNFGASSPGLDYNEPGGYVAFDTSKLELIVAFRGDPSFQSVPSIAKFGQVSSLVSPDIATLQVPPGTLMNVDFVSLFRSISSTVTQVIAAGIKQTSQPTVTFTGHGVGGALASIAAVAYAASAASDTQVQLITFGSPRVGNTIWANYSDSIFSSRTNARSLRVTEVDDNVPQLLPLQNGYRHTSFEVYDSGGSSTSSMLSLCGGQEDIHCNLGQVKSLIQSKDEPIYSTQSSQLTAAPESPSDSRNNGLATESASSSSCSTCVGMECIDCFPDVKSASVGNSQAGSEAGLLDSITASDSSSAAPQEVQPGLDNGSSPINQGQILSVWVSPSGDQIVTELLADGSVRRRIVAKDASDSSILSANSIADQSSIYPLGTSSGSSALSNIPNTTPSVFVVPLYQFHANVTATEDDAATNINTEQITRRSASARASEGHMVYLGVHMTQDGPALCSPTSSQSVSNAQGPAGAIRSQAACYDVSKPLACAVVLLICYLLV